MSKGNLQQVMTRIKGSEASSPIAVFRCEQPGMLDAVFAATVRTQQLIEQRHPDLIGVYDGTMNLNKVFQKLAGNVRYAINAGVTSAQ